MSIVIDKGSSEHRDLCGACRVIRNVFCRQDRTWRAFNLVTQRQVVADHRVINVFGFARQGKSDFDQDEVRFSDALGGHVFESEQFCSSELGFCFDGVVLLTEPGLLIHRFMVRRLVEEKCSCIGFSEVFSSIPLASVIKVRCFHSSV